MAMKIGVLGGTFDPIHNGHLVVAETVTGKLGLAEVILVPAGQPWLKSDRRISPAGHRLEMVRLAIAGKTCFRVSTIEIERAGPSYTLDTIAQLQAELGAEVELFFILGWDSLAELDMWREPAELIKRCCLVAVPRPGYAAPDLNLLERKIPGLSRRVVLLAEPHVDISASDIRERIARRQPIDHLVPAPVAEYIRQHRLYQTG